MVSTLNNTENKKKKISVILSAYNSEKYIGEAIESVLDQTYVHFECIIINDCSTDKTLEIIKTYAKLDNRISIINNKKNLGLTKSLNKGISKSSGKYIARIDADDICEHSRFEKQLKYMEANPEVAVCGSLGTYIDENGKNLGVKNLPLSSKDLKNKLLFNNQFIHSALFIRKSVLDTVGSYDESFKTSQDYELLLRIAEKYPVINLADPLVKWRIHRNSISWKSKKQERDAIRARWLAVTKYHYPKIKGLILISIRIIWMIIPLSVKKKRYLA